MTIYFALLIISLVALLAGCFFLWREISRFGGFGSVSGRVSSIDEPAVLIVAATQPQAIA
jgi:hypothetical protein